MSYFNKELFEDAVTALAHYHINNCSHRRGIVELKNILPAIPERIDKAFEAIQKYQMKLALVPTPFGNITTISGTYPSDTNPSSNVSGNHLVYENDLNQLCNYLHNGHKNQYEMYQKYIEENLTKIFIPNILFEFKKYLNNNCKDCVLDNGRNTTKEISTTLIQLLLCKHESLEHKLIDQQKTIDQLKSKLINLKKIKNNDNDNL